ncbi:hypothetical protein [Halobacterium yunchengense]|uniref:hypothetical protein n=1 Tax=Halobacterium yunchengense TaxID=3108497 RepID=UPI00300B21A6
MTVRYRLVLRSTETRPSRETQEHVLPALAQQFGRRVDVTAADLAPDDRLRAATIGAVTVEDADALCDVYEYLAPNRLVKLAAVEASDDASVVVRKRHEVDRGDLEDRDDVSVLGAAHGDVLLRLREDE